MIKLINYKEDIDDIDKIIEAFNYLPNRRHTAHKQLDWPGQSEEDSWRLVWIGVKIYKRQIEPINYC